MQAIIIKLLFYQMLIIHTRYAWLQLSVVHTHLKNEQSKRTGYMDK